MNAPEEISSDSMAVLKTRSLRSSDSLNRKKAVLHPVCQDDHQERSIGIEYADRPVLCPGKDPCQDNDEQVLEKPAQYGGNSINRSLSGKALEGMHTGAKVKNLDLR